MKSWGSAHRAVGGKRQLPCLRRLRRSFQSSLRLYQGSDMIGAALGGAVKNVIAIAAGICAGQGLGDNARAGLITRGLAENTLG